MNLNEAIGYVVVLVVGWVLARFFPGKTPANPTPSPTPASPTPATGRPLLDLILAIIGSRLTPGTPIMLPTPASPSQPAASTLAASMTPEELAMLDKLLDKALAAPQPALPLDPSATPVK